MYCEYHARSQLNCAAKEPFFASVRQISFLFTPSASVASIDILSATGRSRVELVAEGRSGVLEAESATMPPGLGLRPLVPLPSCWWCSFSVARNSAWDSCSSQNPSPKRRIATPKCKSNASLYEWRKAWTHKKCKF